MVPAFTPYIEIPQLSRYQFNMIELHADRMTDDGFHLWQYNDKDIDRLKDNERKCGLNVPYTSSVITIRLGLSFFTILTMRAIVSGLRA